ncbi:MAG TPA: hypothetical protein VNM90_29395 [Haliangium sp.]|nr:hypothetical protein [Haliangium sp.]
MSPRTPERQSSIASFIHGWMLRCGLASHDRAARVAPIIATFACRCSPDERDPDVTDRGYEVAAMFLALFFAFDDWAVQHQADRDTLDQIRRLLAAQDEAPAAGCHPWLLAVSKLLDALSGADRRDVQGFAAALADHLYAVEEEALARISTDGATGAPAHELCDRIDEFLRLRPLLIATEPNIRIWQTVLGRWPAPSFVQTVASLAPGVRRAHPHAGLDRALDLARLAHARAPAGLVRRSSALSELEALTVVLTYLANDLGSVDRDRSAGGPDQEPNLVLHLERYFLAGAQARVSSSPWDEEARSLPAAEQAEAITVDMYNAGIARLQTLVRLTLEHDVTARPYLSLLIRIVDGNLQSTRDHAIAQAGTASDSEPATAGQELQPRFSSTATLMRLRFVDDVA